MTKYIGPFANTKELQQTLDVAKRLGMEGQAQYWLTFKANGARAAKPGRKAKRVACPECGQTFEKPQSLGPHSRIHKKAVEAEVTT